MINKTIILDEIKAYLGIEKDTEFANYLGIKRSRLATWRNRNMYDPEILFAKCNFLNTEVLLGGEGDLIKSKNTQNVTISKSNKKGNKQSNKQNIQKKLPFTLDNLDEDLIDIFSYIYDKKEDLSTIKAALYDLDKVSIEERLNKLEFFMSAVSLKIKLDYEIEETESGINLKKKNQVRGS